MLLFITIYLTVARNVILQYGRRYSIGAKTYIEMFLLELKFKLYHYFI